MMWFILGAITAVLLVLFWNSRNFVWGGFTLGLVVGFLWKIISLFTGNEVGWIILLKIGIIVALVGFLLEILEFTLERWTKKS